MSMPRNFDLAILGGPAAVTLPAPVWPVSGELESAWMEGVVRSGQWSWNGPHETAFRSEFASFIGAKHCLCMANGTVTLECALEAVGVRSGDEVIVPGLTWQATAQAPLDIGARLVLVDIDAETMCIDPAAIERAITPRTKAVIVVHLYGAMCDMDAVCAIVKKYDLKLIEDVAHQHGSRWRNRGAGSIGDVGSFSFQQSKVLTSGEGGAVTCNDDAILESLHVLKHVGFTPEMKHANRYGHNYRITEMQAALLRGGLRRLPDQTRLRDENAERIAEGLRRIGGPLRVVRRDPRVTRQAYYGLSLVYDRTLAGGLDRQIYIDAACAEGATLWKTYPPLYASPQINFYDPASPHVRADPAAVQDLRKLLLPNVERCVFETHAVMPQTLLLGGEKYTAQLVSAFAKLSDRIGTLRERFPEPLPKAS